MNRRLLGAILLITFLVLSVSGLFMYFTPFQKNVASLHTVFALIFLIFILFHIVNNKKPLSNYIAGRIQKKIQKIILPLITVVLVILSVGLFLDVPYLNGIYNWGNSFRNEQIGKAEQSFVYDFITLDTTFANNKITIEFKKGEAFKYPVFAIWAEDTSGNYLETLYISRAISSSTFKYGQKVEDKWEPAIVRRPEALPYWSHKRGIKASDGLFIPLEKAPDLDGVTGATPTNNFIIQSKFTAKDQNKYKIFLEVNQSFDWNDFYTAEKFQDDPIYSGSGKVGQPSLIYSAEVNTDDFDTQREHYLMELTGHGHHSGETGELYTNLNNITTAKMIADRIILTVQ